MGNPFGWQHRRRTKEQPRQATTTPYRDIFIAPNNGRRRPARNHRHAHGSNQTLSVDTSPITDIEGTSTTPYSTTSGYGSTTATKPTSDRATRSTYNPSDQDADKQIKVKVSFTDDEGFDEGPLSSEPTIRIVGADVLVRNTGQTLTSSGEIISVQAGTHAQQFTTGPAADGYALHSIGFRFFSITDTSVASSQLILALNENTNGSPWKCPLQTD